MLVLSRKIDESFEVGEDVTITILRIKGNQVRVGIDAPRKTRVLRSELQRRNRELDETFADH